MNMLSKVEENRYFWSDPSGLLVYDNLKIVCFYVPTS